MGDRMLRLVRLMTTMVIGILFLEIGSAHASSLSTRVMVQSGITLSPLFLGVLIVGGCIIITLSYVSWKKYKAEVKNTTSDRKNDKSVD